MPVSGTALLWCEQAKKGARIQDRYTLVRVQAQQLSITGYELGSVA
jgi:hypothetical protein